MSIHYPCTNIQKINNSNNSNRGHNKNALYYQT